MRWTLAFSIWTLFVWTGRVRNIVADSSLDGFGVVWRVGLAGAFVVLAIVTLALLWRASSGASTWLGRLGPVVRGFAIFTTVVWVVRAGGILLDAGHAAGFKVVHTVLAVASIALAWQADRETAGRSRRTVAARPSVAG